MVGYLEMRQLTIHAQRSSQWPSIIAHGAVVIKLVNTVSGTPHQIYLITISFKHFFFLKAHKVILMVRCLRTTDIHICVFYTF